MPIKLGGGFMSDLSEDYGKRKEEILERSRNTTNDEGLENAKKSGIDWGLIFSAVSVAIPLLVFSIITQQYLVAYAIFAMNGAFIAGRFFTIYRFTKNRQDIIFTLIGVISAICGIATFVIEVVRG